MILWRRILGGAGICANLIVALLENRSEAEEVLCEGVLRIFSLKDSNSMFFVGKETLGRLGTTQMFNFQ